MPVGSVEISLPPGGDFTLLPNGDVLLVQDTPGNPAATTQRVIRLILSNARVVNQSAGFVSTADDRFNQSWGSSARAAVGAGINQNLETTIQSLILNALASDPDIANVPAPTVTVTQTGIFSVVVDVACQDITGEAITIPSLPITVASGA